MRKPEDIVFPAGQQALYEQNRYSPAVKSGDFLFVSGQVGSREDGSAEPGLEQEIRRAFDNLNAVLAAADCTLMSPSIWSMRNRLSTRSGRCCRNTGEMPPGRR